MLPILFAFGPIVIHSFGVILLLAFILGSFVFWQKAREENYDEIEIFDLILACVFWSLLGSRISYILLHFEDFGLNIWYWLAVWVKPGFYWIGLLIGGSLCLYKLTKDRKWDIAEMFDLSVIGLSLAQAITHLGLFLSGSGVGAVTSLPIGVMFPGLFDKRHPVGLYGFFIWLFGFWLMWWLENKYRRFDWYQKFKGDARPGFVAFSYLIFSGFSGLILAALSEPEYVFFGIDLEYPTRVLMIIAGSVGIYLKSGVKFRFEWRSKIRAAAMKKDKEGAWKKQRNVENLD